MEELRFASKERVRKKERETFHWVSNDIDTVKLDIQIEREDLTRDIVTVTYIDRE